MERQEIKDNQKPETENENKKGLPQGFKIGFFIFVVAALGFGFYRFKDWPKEGDQAGLLSGLAPETIQVNSLAPNFVSEDVYGNEVSLSDFQEKSPVLLVFWATWCGFCAKELPDLKTFTQERQNEVQVIAIGSGETKETIKEYIQEKEINFLMVLDEDRKIWNQYLVRGTPYHFLISDQGKITSLRYGLSSKKELEMLMTTLTEP